MMWMYQHCSRYIACMLLMLSPVALLATSSPQVPALDIGSSAPSLQTAQLIKGTAVPRFEPGKTYVVDFWATWCAPCKALMPHLSNLAAQYKDRVQIVSISVREEAMGDLPPQEVLKNVTAFVTGQGRKMNYTVMADDPAGSINKAWLIAAGEASIPRAYIVNNGKILWIGRPDDGMEEPLRQIIEGRYDASADLLERTQEQELKAQLRRLREYKPLQEADESNDYAKQLQIYEVAFAVNPQLEKQRFGGLFSLLVHVDPKRARDYARDKIQGSGSPKEKERWQYVAATVVLEEEIKEPALLDFALECAERAVAAQKEPSSKYLHRLAAVHFARGEFSHAVQEQERALAIAQKIPEHDPVRPMVLKTFQEELEEYKAAEEGSARTQ